jgi:hypothetical protein
VPLIGVVTVVIFSHSCGCVCILHLTLMFATFAQSCLWLQLLLVTVIRAHSLVHSPQPRDKMQIAPACGSLQPRDKMRIAPACHTAQPSHQLFVILVRVVVLTLTCFRAGYLCSSLQLQTGSDVDVASSVSVVCDFVFFFLFSFVFLFVFSFVFLTSAFPPLFSSLFRRLASPTTFTLDLPSPTTSALSGLPTAPSSATWQPHRPGRRRLSARAERAEHDS